MVSCRIENKSSPFFEFSLFKQYPAARSLEVGELGVRLDRLLGEVIGLEQKVSRRHVGGLLSQVAAFQKVAESDIIPHHGLNSGFQVRLTKQGEIEPPGFGISFLFGEQPSPVEPEARVFGKKLETRFAPPDRFVAFLPLPTLDGREKVALSVQLLDGRAGEKRNQEQSQPVAPLLGPVYLVDKRKNVDHEEEAMSEYPSSAQDHKGSRHRKRRACLYLSCEFFNELVSFRRRPCLRQSPRL